MSGFNNDYVEVHERLVKFHEKYPEGRVTTLQAIATSEPDGVPRVWVEAAAYRTPDDPVPARGWSWMILPGSTNFTRGSELENTETSAWGRAMAAAGIEVKRGIASASEVRNKSGEGSRPAAPRPVPSSPAGVPAPDVYEGRIDKGRAPVDMQLRQTPDGPVYGFVLLEDIPGGKFPRKTQVLVEGDLAEDVALDMTARPQPTAMVWGSVEMVPWEKDGKAMNPFRRVHATRVMTPDWTHPAKDAAAPASVAPSASGDRPEDFDDLAF